MGARQISWTCKQPTIVSFKEHLWVVEFSVSKMLVFTAEEHFVIPKTPNTTKCGSGLWTFNLIEIVVPVTS